MADQAQNLRNFVLKTRKHAHVITVTSGKGGVGKTNTSVNLAIALAAHKKRVTLIDADLGLANVEVLLGLNSLYNLQHVINGEKSMSQILVQGPGGIHVVPGSSGIAKLADLDTVARQNVLRGLSELQEEFDFIIIDTMAGIGQNVVAFASAADEVLLVCTPEPSSQLDAYAMLKTILQVREDAVIRLVVNMAVNVQQANAVAAKLGGISQRFLGRSLACIGHIPRDPHVSHGVMQMKPFILQFEDAPATKAIQEIAARIIHHRVEADRAKPGFIARFMQSLGLASNG